MGRAVADAAGAVDTAVVDAAAAVAPGWPRRRSRCAFDVEPDGTVSAGAPGARPTPWAATVIATASGGVWDALEFDEGRCERMLALDLCQVCGRPRGEQVFVLAAQNRSRTAVLMYGGALCSLECARLTAAQCPHYTSKSPVEVFSMPRQERVDLLGGGYANDDEYRIDGVEPIARVHPVEAGRGGRR
ncbi:MULTISPECIES: hypothetical protein [Actinosynnema]|uniref:hypothetical protein n=1 Tax=Actinosynnema TaxID=40566 RepID=UPI0020A58F71|nr:hypothetical protein [Actinosynnema pretiosum]